MSVPYEMLKVVFPAIRPRSKSPAELDRSIANRFLLTTWAPERFLHSYNTPVSLEEVLNIVIGDSSLKRKVRELKRYARKSESGWRRRAVRQEP